MSATTTTLNPSDFVYVDAAFGGVNKRNNVKRLDTVRLNGLSDCYVSHNRATADLLTWRNTHQNENGNPTVAGFDGPTWAPDLHLDYDNEADPGQALIWLRQGLDWFEAHDVDLRALRIFFSGYKGFGVEVPHTLLGGFEPAIDFHTRLRRAAKHILGTIPYDTSVYDRIRLWRLPNSRHGKSKLYKIRLTVAEARTLTIDEIRALAATPRDESTVPELAPIEDDEWLPVPELVAIWEATVSPESDEGGEPGERRSPTNEARDRLTVSAIATSWPHGGRNAVEGESENATVSRHAEYLMPIIGFLAGRTSAEHAGEVVATAAQEAGDQTFLHGRDWRGEIKRIVDSTKCRLDANEDEADAKRVKGLPSLRKRFPGVADVLEALWPAPRINLSDNGYFPPGDPEPNGAGSSADDAGPTGQHGHTNPTQHVSAIRPVIKTSGRDPKDVAEDAIRAVQDANQPEPRLFVRGGALVRTRTTELGRPVVDALDRDSLFHTLVDVAQWFRYDMRAKGWKPTGPPDDVVRYISGHHALPFPALVGITEAPIIRPDGTIITTAGYDPVTRLIYRPSPGLVVAAIPDTPSAEDVATARETLIDLVHDFAFAEDGGDDTPSASRTNAYALLLTLVLRPAIDGAAPLAAINKNSPGAGATLLTEVFGIIAHGRVPGLTALPTDDSELEKRITTLLRDGEPINVFDNVDQALEHGSLSLVLTATEWAGRVLGRSETARYPNRAVWIANGVNLTLRGDIARRAYETRIVVDDTQPWRLEGGEQRFRHPKLMEWAEQHRGHLLGACLTLARNWYAKGQPAPSTPTLGMFEGWCRVIGGVLETAGIGGFLGNLDALYHNVDAESPEWAAFLDAWFDRYGSAEVAAKQVETDLKGAAPGSLLDTLPGELASALNDPRRSFAHRLGQALTKRVERRYGERKLRIVRGGNAARGKWRVDVGLDLG